MGTCTKTRTKTHRYGYKGTKTHRQKNGMVTGGWGLFGWPPKKIVVISKKPKVKTFKTKQTMPLIFLKLFSRWFCPSKVVRCEKLSFATWARIHIPSQLMEEPSYSASLMHRVQYSEVFWIHIWTYSAVHSIHSIIDACGAKMINHDALPIKCVCILFNFETLTIQSNLTF